MWDTHQILKSIRTGLTTLIPSVFNLRVNHLCLLHPFSILGVKYQRTHRPIFVFECQLRGLGEAFGLV